MHDEPTDYSLPPLELVAKLPPLLTINQAAKTGAASARMLRKMCANNQIKAIKVGSDWRIYRDEFFDQFFFVK
ncbi:MAG: helix-turn-helix domain-containing protein [Coriobacteriales bacterium]|nr:helix-turn-helix domain-containing protein [Coriobacteriales bacterium]